MRISVFVQETEPHHRVVSFQVCLYMGDFIALKVLLNFLLKYIKRIGKINFKRTRVVRGRFHARGVLSSNLSKISIYFFEVTMRNEIEFKKLAIGYWPLAFGRNFVCIARMNFCKYLS